MLPFPHIYTHVFSSCIYDVHAHVCTHTHTHTHIYFHHLLPVAWCGPWIRFLPLLGFLKVSPGPKGMKE